MDRNCKKPYRGLPTEIRLEIWKFTISNSGCIRYGQPTGDNRHLEFPKLQSQLLRLNREVHNEVLPLFRKIEIVLSPEVDCERDWVEICQALRSPTMNRLKIIRQIPDTRYNSTYRSSAIFLSKFLIMDIPCSLHTLVINFDHIDNYLHPYFTNSCWIHRITHDLAISAFAAAFLAKGLVYEVRVNIGSLPDNLLSTWSATNLHRCVIGLCQSMQVWEEDMTFETDFWQEIAEIAGSNCGHNIHIETAFSKNDSIFNEFEGSVVFTLQSK